MVGQPGHDHQLVVGLQLGAELPLAGFSAVTRIAITHTALLPQHGVLVAVKETQGLATTCASSLGGADEVGFATFGAINRVRIRADCGVTCTKTHLIPLHGVIIASEQTQGVSTDVCLSGVAGEVGFATLSTFNRVRGGADCEIFAAVISIIIVVIIGRAVVLATREVALAVGVSVAVALTDAALLVRGAAIVPAAAGGRGTLAGRQWAVWATPN